MIKFKKSNQKEWEIFDKDDNLVITLQLKTSSITNKYHLITNFIEGMVNECGEQCHDWFINFITTCQKLKNRGSFIIDNIPNIKLYVDSYIKSKNIDFSQFVDMTKANKNSILFDPTEIEKIIKLSSYLKVYSVIFNNDELELGMTQHREVYNEIASEALDGDIVRKIYDVIKTKTFKYKLTDKFMWEYIKNIQGKDVGIHVVEIFNFIMNQILILCEEDRNPIAFFNSIIDDAVNWFLRSVYKGSIVYDDSVATEDIQGINVDNLMTYSYNDTLGRLKSIAYDKIYELLEKNAMSVDFNGKDDERIIRFHERAKSIEFVSPLCETVVFPILSKMTKIPHSHFKTLSPEHACIISVYIQKIFRKVFKTEYKEISNLMNYYPNKQPSVVTTYKIKAISNDSNYIDIQNNFKNFYGFNIKTMPYDLMSNFIGRVSRIDFCDVLTGKSLGGIPLTKIEKNMVKFFTTYFAGEIDDEIEQMAELMNMDF